MISDDIRGIANALRDSAERNTLSPCILDISLLNLTILADQVGFLERQAVSSPVRNRPSDKELLDQGIPVLGVSTRSLP